MTVRRLFLVSICLVLAALAKDGSADQPDKRLTENKLSLRQHKRQSRQSAADPNSPTTSPPEGVSIAPDDAEALVQQDGSAKELISLRPFFPTTYNKRQVEEDQSAADPNSPTTSPPEGVSIAPDDAEALEQQDGLTKIRPYFPTTYNKRQVEEDQSAADPNSPTTSLPEGVSIAPDDAEALEQQDGLAKESISLRPFFQTIYNKRQVEEDQSAADPNSQTTPPSEGVSIAPDDAEALVQQDGLAQEPISLRPFFQTIYNKRQVEEDQSAADPNSQTTSPPEGVSIAPDDAEALEQQDSLAKGPLLETFQHKREVEEDQSAADPKSQTTSSPEGVCAASELAQEPEASSEPLLPGTQHKREVPELELPVLGDPNMQAVNLNSYPYYYGEHVSASAPSTDGVPKPAEKPIPAQLLLKDTK